jgi:hypothetical protein
LGQLLEGSFDCYSYGVVGVVSECFDRCGVLVFPGGADGSYCGCADAR